MENNFSKEYDRIKRSKKSYNNYTKKFFSGINELKSFSFPSEISTSSERVLTVKSLFFSFRYAFLVIAAVFIVSLIGYPIINKAYFDNKYKQNLFNDLTYSFVDSGNYLFSEEDLTKTINIDTKNY